MKREDVISTIAASTIAILSFCVWAFLLPNHLKCQESIQLFCYDSAYLWEMYAFPGGMASLISGFLIQFFLHPIAGATIISALSLLMLFTVRKACRCSLAMAVVPVLLMNAMLTSINFTLAAPVAFLICLWAFIAIRSSRADTTTGHCIVAAFLYLLTGPVAVIYPLLLIIKGNLRSGLPTLIVTLAAPAVSALLSCHQPWWRFFTGLDYSHARKTASLLPLSLPLSVVAILVICAFKHGKGWTVPALFLCLGIFSAWKAIDSHALEREQTYAYDQAARESRWDSILSMASRHSPDNIPSLVCYNLALAETHQLGDLLFSVQQGGPQGLFPSYESNYLSMVTGSEALFHAGLINSAMHYAFEANWAYPDLHQSVRQVLMLQKTNALGGYEEVAGKYASLLSKTLYYKHSSIPAAILRTDESKGLLLNDSDDFSKQAMLRELLADRDRCTEESLEYLLAYDLLCKDLESFTKDLEQFWPEGKQLPRCYQEALMMPYMTGRNAGNGMNPLISQETREKAAEFIKALKERKGDAYMISHFGDTYWSYHARNK